MSFYRGRQPSRAELNAKNEYMQHANDPHQIKNESRPPKAVCIECGDRATHGNRCIYCAAEEL